MHSRRVLCFPNAGSAEDMYTSEGTGARRAASPLLVSLPQATTQQSICYRRGLECAKGRLRSFAATRRNGAELTTQSALPSSFQAETYAGASLPSAVANRPQRHCSLWLHPVWPRPLIW